MEATAIGLSILIRITTLIIFFWSVISIATHYSNSLILQIISIAMICVSGVGILISPSKNMILEYAALIAFFWAIIAIVTHYSDSVIFQILAIIIIFLTAARILSPPLFIFIQSPLIAALTAFFWVVIAITTYYFDNTIPQIIAFIAISAIGSIAMAGIFFIGLFCISHLLSLIFPSWKHKKSKLR